MIYDGYMKKFIVLLVIVIGSACIWYQYSLLPVNAESEVRLTVNVPSGSSVTAIADILEGKGVIRSSRAFRIFLAFHYPDAVFQAGAFVMQPSQTIDEVVDVLSTGLGQEMKHCCCGTMGMQQFPIPPPGSVQSISNPLSLAHMRGSGSFMQL